MHKLRISWHAVCGVLLSVLCYGNAVAQQVEWSVDFNTLFDNREGDDKFTDTKTFFHTQLAPEIGLSALDGTHAIMGGVVWTQPIGCEWEGHRVSPTLYYRYNSSTGWKFLFGMFSRAQLITAMPNYVWNDSIYYTQRNVRGAMIQYSDATGYFEGVLDWRGMQTETQREAFNIIARGEWRPGTTFLLGGLALMNHYAKQKNAPVDQSIVDNFIVNPYVGVNLAKSIDLDSATVRVGALSSITRNRGTNDGWKTPVGLWADVAVEKNWLGAKETFYYGGKLFPYYQQHRWLLDQGEPYYQSKCYSRTQVYAYFMRNAFMNLQASLDFNVAKGNFTFYQRLVLRMYIDDKLWTRRRSSASAALLRSIY